MRGVLVLILLAGCDAIFGVAPFEERTPADDAGPDGASTGCPGWFEALMAPSISEPVTSIAAAQLDGMPGDELVVTTASGYVILSGEGAQYSSQSTFGLAFTPTEVLAVDLDGQRPDELVFVVRGANAIDVFGVGNGGAYDSIDGFDTGAQPMSVVSGEIDGAPGLDLAWVSNGNHRIEVALRREGGFSSPQTAVDTGEEPVALAAGHLDGNSTLDFVAGWQSSLTTAIRAAAAYDGTDKNLGFSVIDLVLADIDETPGDEVIVAVEGSLILPVLRYVGGVLEPDLPISVLIQPERLAMRDLDGDADPELIVAGSSGDQNFIYVFQGAPGLTFSKVFEVPLTATAAAMTVDDLDDDGRPDLALAASNGQLTVLRNCR